MRNIARLFRTKISLALALLVAVCFVGFVAQQGASANHPVLVEGEEDFDGDGLRGVMEDNDNGTDRIFGTITQALLGANGGANANGSVLIVTSGRFPELIRIPNTGAGQMTLNGVTIIEAAPGVAADLDGVLQGFTGMPSNADRQAAPGIIVNTDLTDRSVILRNLIIRNYTEGVQVMGASRVLIDSCRLDDNLNFGIRAMGTSRVTILNTTVNASGQRFNPMAGTPGPGTGIRFEEMSRGAVVRSTVSGNTAAGISNASNGTVVLLQNSVFDNGTNFTGASANAKPFRFAAEESDFNFE
jgi:hypothetical protein